MIEYKKTAVAILLMVAMVLAKTSQASEFYNFTYIPDTNDIITGSFRGTANGDMIIDLTDVTVFYNGVAFLGNGQLDTGSLPDGTNFVAGGAKISFSGTNNSFIFLSKESRFDDGTADAFFSSVFVAGSYFETYGEVKSSNFHFLTTIRPNATNWLVTSVPLPGSFWLFGSGLGLLALKTNRKLLV